MSRGYGKSYRKGYSHASFQFDKLFKENSNRPSAARSAGTVGKWGITSFTSIRSSNGLPTPQYPEVTPTNKRMKLDETDQNTKSKSKDPFSFGGEQGGLSDKNNSSSNIQPVKPKKFFKSRNAKPSSDEVQSDSAKCSDKVDFSYGASASPSKKPKASYGAKKFFPSKRSPSPPPTATAAATTAAAAAAAVAAKREDNKPPIVLRISRGKSRLLSDSDESESTPTTPSSATVTSPRDSQQPTRITRSTRRSMQQDLSNDSPTSAEPPVEPFASLLSPEYIAPEKFELERKAMYDNLLGPSSPVDSSVGTTAHDTTTASQPAEPDSEEPIFTTGSQELEGSSQETEDITKDSQESGVNEELSQATESSGIFTEDTLGNTQDSQEIIPEPLDTNTLSDNSDKEKMNEAEELFSSVTDELSEPPVDTSTPSVVDPAPSPPAELASAAAAAAAVAAADTSSESDSESSQPPPPAADDPSASSANTIDQHRDEIMEKILEKPAAIEAPAVKLVISKKKGSIFKSRSMVQDGSKKRHALYKHKWCDDKEAQKANENLAEKKDSATDSSHFDDYDFESAPLTRVTRTVNSDFSLDGPDSVTSVHCNKKDKDFYTVIRNVKKAHQIQEIGEFQEFNDDVEYILDALQDNNPTGTRCLSAITLATKCMAPAFRMHVRAHGIVAKFFRALHDATKDQSLGLCTATVMFVLSQDRLNMDLDRDCLELMLNLLESDVSYQKALDECGMSSAQLHKNKLKVRELCAEIQSQGHAMHLNLDNITVGQLAMETLLSLTSKRAGEWFKEELRELGGLQHIMETICECCRQVSDYVVVWTETLLDKLRKVDRCMRVLENVTQNNEQNQTYLLQYNNGIILDTLVKLYRLCDAEIPLYPATDITDKESTGAVIREALLVTLKVLINLTHHFSKKSMGSTLIGSKPGIVDASLHLLLQIPHYIPEQKKFELGVLVLMLLINLIQDSDNNKKLLVNAKAPADFESIFACDKSALEALIKQFYNCEELARMAERRTDAILDGEKDTEAQSQPKSHEEFIEETVAKLLQKAGTHMEYTFLASYITMLIGFLIMDNPEYEQNVRQYLKGHTFRDMVDILKKFFSFMNLTASTDASNVCQIKATEVVIKYMEECDNKTLALTAGTSTPEEHTQNLNMSS